MNLFESNRTDEGKSKSAKLAEQIFQPNIEKNVEVENNEVEKAEVEKVEVKKSEVKNVAVENTEVENDKPQVESRFSLSKFDKLSEKIEENVELELNKPVEDFQVEKK